MKKKKMIFLVLTVLSLNACSVYKMKVYSFNDEVINLLSKRIEEEKNECPFIIINNINSGVVPMLLLSNYQRLPKQTQKFIKSSDRFIKTNKNKIPIIFFTDYFVNQDRYISIFTGYAIIIDHEGNILETKNLF